MSTDTDEMQAAQERLRALRGLLGARGSRKELDVADALLASVRTPWDAWEAVVHLESMVRYSRARPRRRVAGA